MAKVCEVSGCMMCDNGRCLECNLGYFRVDYHCSPCKEFCMACSSNDKCLKCDDGYSLNSGECLNDSKSSLTVIVICSIIPAIIVLTISAYCIYRCKKMHKFTRPPRNHMHSISYSSNIIPTETNSEQRNPTETNSFAKDIQQKFDKAVTKVTFNKQLKYQGCNVCAICMSDILEAEMCRITKCSHLFHDECITSWFKNQNKCPCDNMPLITKSVVYP